MRIRPYLLVLALLVTCSFSMMSCVKNYTCQCVIKYSGYPGLPDSTINTYTITNDKTDAQSKCKSESGTYSNPPITTVETCILY